ncbi:MAG: alpha/beta fold hydrolase [Syntrophales bacterium]|jgi:pimeloyl-ACP methyl ester carboxylesterase|nr:alpha/beta fold hydrolase [Syntrophales bacterium]MCK9528243.1 alpha/beta fold hydrolase [Syntrophales bacterium]MDX9922374.1 alpha/beta fold hydrolase [Syntrophales bacterium]
MHSTVADIPRGPGVTVTDSYTRTSDGALLRVIDFTPPGETSNTPLLLFVAGWISIISAWEDVLRVVTPRVRTLYLETREKRSARFGRAGSADFSIQRMVDDLDDVIRDRIPADRPFFLAGSSLGSTVILDYLSRERRSPLRAIAIAPNAEFRIPSWFYTLARFIPPEAYGLLKGPIKWHIRKHRIDSVHEKEQVKKYELSLDRADPRRLKASALAMKGYSLWPKFPLIKVPVVIVGAETDLLHGVNEMERMAAMIPGARLEVMASNRETHSDKAGRLIIQEIEPA